MVMNTIFLSHMHMQSALLKTRGPMGNRRVRVARWLSDYDADWAVTVHAHIKINHDKQTRLSLAQSTLFLMQYHGDLDLT